MINIIYYIIKHLVTNKLNTMKTKPTPSGKVFKIFNESIGKNKKLTEKQRTDLFLAVCEDIKDKHWVLPELTKTDKKIIKYRNEFERKAFNL